MSSQGEIDRMPVSQLPDRYEIVRSALYERLKVLNIQTEKIGNRAYVNANQLQLLDDLHRFIQHGGNAAEFLAARGMDRKDAMSSGLSGGLSRIPPDIFQLITTIAAEIASKIQPPPAQPELLAHFYALEEAARNGWLLSTTELAELLDLSPSEIKRFGDRFQEAGFIFIRAGFRARGEVAWRVSKGKSLA